MQKGRGGRETDCIHRSTMCFCLHLTGCTHTTNTAPKPKAKVPSVDICTQTFSGVFDDSMTGGATGWATTVPVTDCVSNVSAGRGY